MKKIFYFLASAIVALGAMACQNEVDENINPNTQSDVVSFTVAFDEATRIAMTTEGKTAKFAFEAGDVLYVQPRATLENDEVFVGNTYEFTTEDGKTFSCQSAELVSELAQSGNYANVDNSADGSIRSNEGVDGFNFATYADLTAETVTLPMSHAVFHFTVPEGTTATLKHTEDIFDTEAVVGWEKEMTFTEGEHWVAAWTFSGTLSYSINGVVVKSIEKDFEAGKIYNLGTLDTNMTIANVAALIEKAEAGSTITLPAGATITGSEILTISKNITINGNGATLSSTAGRAINIDTNGEVNISNLTINCTGARAFNIINQPATVNISGVTATATNNAVMVATSAGAATVNVAESTLNGMNVVYVAGKDAKVTVTGCTLNCNDKSDVEAYAALALFNTAEGAKITATDCDITFNGDSYAAWNETETGTITADGYEVKLAIAYISYGDNAYSFDNLPEAIETAKDGDTIVLIRDAKIDQVGEFKIDLNGHKLTAADGYIATKDGENIKVVALGEAIENWGVVGAHQGWNTDKTDKMFQIPGTNTYVKRNVTLGKDGFKFYGTSFKQHPAVTTGEEGDYYLAPNSNWKQAGARFAIYFFEGEDYAWVSMKDDNGDGIYVANKPTDGKTYTNMIFCRMNPANTTNNWNNKWNQTGNLTCPTNGNNCFTITDGSWDAGKWSVHTPEVKDAWTEPVINWLGYKNGQNFTTNWVQCWSNNLGENKNITVKDLTKTYDIYFSKGADQDWGFEYWYTVVESGTVLDTLK